MVIPIQNIYYLLSYAWDKTHLLLKPQLVGSEISDNLTNLLTDMLLPEVQLLVAQGLATDYITQTRSVKGIKGKLLLTETFRQDSKLTSGRTICAIEELSSDILPNQIIKSTFVQLQQTNDLAPVFHKQIKDLLPAFASIRAFSPAIPKRELILPRFQTARYQFVLHCCAFIRQNLLPVNGGQEYTFKAFLTNKKQMATIFEAFVRNFYRREQNIFQVKSERIDWQGPKATKEAQDFLPAMFTDISLQSEERKIIIDTKYYKKAFLPHHQKEKLHSKHLYQLFAYLQNSLVRHPEQIIEGILLYPAVNKELNLEYTLSGKKVRICTINLNQPWLTIKQDLLELLA
ncbi:hypothetical protein AHMF7605_08905 [Adhaeribacter arboris]|uniref:Restriction endonuclease n=1 Tax=Adhaeribacter arboris TaxID=2072846 RepID=A0A2T2YDP5_9BACT|nr:hypothetical protein [Adhaeribacter arboris]PSR53632.1 hypothetical protein AHMF7605_08905 [Adhaeribacter arboris]